MSSTSSMEDRRAERGGESRTRSRPVARLVVAIGVTVALLAGFGSAALASYYQSETSAVYTGCLKTNGQLHRVAIGDQPSKACNSNETQISWSETGPPGSDGQDGADGVSGYSVEVAEFTVGAGEWLGDQTSAFGEVVLCPAGASVLGGGFHILDGVAITELRTSAPDNLGQDGWRVSLRNTTGVDGLRVQLYATCAIVN